MLRYLSSVGQQLTLTTLLILFICVAAQARENDNPPTPREESRTGLISGRVVSDSGQPLAGATVTVRSGGAFSSGRNTVTNLEGNFQISGLDNALYFITAYYPAYVGSLPSVDAPPPSYRVGDTVRIELVRGGVITGTVTNSSGEPVIGVRVRSFMIRDTSGKSTKGMITLGGERTTDDRGIYRIFGLAPGSYIVQAGGGGIQTSANPTDFDAPTFAPSSTRDTATEIQVRGGEESTVDIRYRGEPGRTVSGTVKIQGNQGASVSLIRVGDGMRTSSSAYQAANARGFMFSGIGDGDYEVTAQEATSLPSTSSPEVSISEPVRFSVRGADVSGLELVPKPLAVITGKLALEPSKVPECQNKRQPLLSETSITPIQNRKEAASDQLAFMIAFLGATIPDKDGAFAIKNMRPGQYSFTPRFFARYWFLKSMTLPPAAPASTTAKTTNSAVRDAAKNWTSVKSGDRVTGLTITLAEGAGSIRGVIDKKEVNDLRVYLVPSERDKVEEPLRYFMSTVNNDGTFALNNLAPGRYWILAQRSQADLPASIEKLRLPDALDARTKIRRSAETVKLEVELKPCQNLTDYKLNPN